MLLNLKGEATGMVFAMKKLMLESLANEFKATLKDNIEQCLYLAIDLETYGLDDNNVTFYYDEKDDKLETLIMKYYDSIQMFSPDPEWNGEKYVNFIKGLSPVAICGRKEMIETLEPLLTEYFSEYGIVIADNHYMDFQQFELVHEASAEDAHDIAALMMQTEEFFQNNSQEVLEKQLYDRIKSGLGRSFIIREDGLIVAHTAIYAQCGNIAVESGLVVHEKYKKKFYGMIIHEYLKKTLSLENKILYGLRYNNNMKNCAVEENLDVKAHCGRLIIRKINY